MSCDHELVNEWARCNGKTPATQQRGTLLTDLGHVVNPVKFATTMLAAVKCGETLMTSFHLKENKMLRKLH